MQVDFLHPYTKTKLSPDKILGSLKPRHTIKRPYGRY